MAENISPHWQDIAAKQAQANKEKWTPDLSQTFGIVAGFIALMIFLLGYLHQYADSLIPFIDNLARDFYANVSSELVSIVITVLVLDRLNARRAKQERKRQLQVRAGSQVNNICGGCA